MKDSVVEVEDFGVLGLITSGAFGSILLGACLVHFIVKTKKKVVGEQIFVSSILSMLFSFLYCLGAVLWRTDLIFNIDFNSDNFFTCDILWYIQSTLYGFSKILLYTFLTYRLETVFEHSLHKMNKTVSILFRIIFILLIISYLILSLLVLPRVEAITKTTNISLCILDTGTF